MKLIIDIDEDYYEYCRTYCESIAECAIAEGTPLPEHGRLIDADELPKHYTKMFSKLKPDTWMYVLEERFINEAPTVIEGSKEDEHKTC